MSILAANLGDLMAQYACTGLEKRQILVVMFLTMFIGLLGIDVNIPVTASQ